MSGRIASLPKHSDDDVSVSVSIPDKRDGHLVASPRPREDVQLVRVTVIVAKLSDEDVQHLVAYCRVRYGDLAARARRGWYHHVTSIEG